MSLILPTNYETTIYAHKNWLSILKKAQNTIEEDDLLQRAAAKGMRLKDRSIPPEVVGRCYAKYCDLVNRMYDAYLNNVQLQRAPYMLEIITVIMKRMYELRNELVHIIVNDYIYVDAALQQLHMTPLDIEIVLPYHFPLESRSENVEQILQQMWVGALKRKRRKERPKKWKPRSTMKDSDGDETAEEDSESPPSSVHTLIPEGNKQSAIIIQRHERYRQWARSDNRAKAVMHRQYFLSNEPAPIEIRTKAALLVQKIYREFMKIKRRKVTDNKRDIMLGLALDPYRSRLSFSEEKNKLYEIRKKTRLKLKKSYLEELEKNKTRLILLKKDNIIEDITDEIREWFYEWFYNYNFFPQFPYELEGGTLIVVKGLYPTVAEQLAEDDRILEENKGMTKEQMNAEKKRLKVEEALKAKVQKEVQKKLDEALLKSKFDPFTDLGYTLQISDDMENLIGVLRNYRQTWSLYDELQPEIFGETIYGYMKPLLVEDVMQEIHIDCRKFVDELMRLDLIMLVGKHKLDYKQIGLKYPKLKSRKKPKIKSMPKKLVLNEKLLKSSEKVFDLGIVTKPTTKISDIFGDSSYAAYDYNIKDPNASFPLPGYGDIKRRLMLSCVFGCGIQPGAPRRKGVLLLGPERNGKSFLADAVAGELNAVKIDITPEVFTAVSSHPEKILTQVFVIARAFQPAVVFMKNVERVFIKRVPPDQKDLNATSLKHILGKLVKSIPNEDKVIFIGHNNFPLGTNFLNDYATLQQFFFQKFQRIRSMPRDYPIQPLAQLTQGFGFGDITRIYNEVMTPERIVRLNVQELSPAEFIQPLLEKGLEPLSVQDYQQYVDFFITNSELKKEREDYAAINLARANFYKRADQKKKTEQND